MKRISELIFCVLMSVFFLVEKTASAQAIIESQFLYENAPFANAHSNTIIETLDGSLLVAAFGGTKEGAEDVCIWLSRRDKGSSAWTAPKKVAEAPEGQTCYNPVLYQLPADKGGDILFFYKIAPAFKYGMSEGYIMRSSDGGRTWSTPVHMGGLVGACKNQPVLVGNRLIAPSSGPKPGGWGCHFEISDDLGYTWRKVEMTEHNPKVHPAQPTILVHDDGRLQALFRTTDGLIATSWSSDLGETWTREEFLSVKNNNSGIDAVKLKDGRFVLIYNDQGNTPGKNKGPRLPLCLAVSEDGINWKKVLTLEDPKKGEYSYPTIIQGADGDLRMIYTYMYREKARYVRVRLPKPLDPSIYRDGWIDFNKNGKKDIYEDRAASIDARIADLRSQMTSEEIKAQINENAYNTSIGNDYQWGPTIHLSAVHAKQRDLIENTRLGIPALITARAIRGVNHVNTTIFPALITLGASWDTFMAGQVAGTIAQEAISLGYNSIDYPVVNHIDDPYGSWNRDTYGESSTLVQFMVESAENAIKDRGVLPVKIDYLKRKSKPTIDDVLRAKFEAGLFDNPFKGQHAVADNNVHKKPQIELAKQAAAKGIVLLKNEGKVLPLSKDIKKIAVVGPNSSEVKRFYSEEGPIGTQARTVLRALTYLMPEVEVVHAPGCGIKDPKFPESERQEFPLNETETTLLADASNAVSDADIVIVVIGGNNDTNVRTTLGLSGRQDVLLESVAAVGKPVIAVILDNRAAALDKVNEYADAIIHAWYPGEATSDALVACLKGEFNPGGKLPVTMPSKDAPFPITFPLKGKNDSKYILYPFGYGLSYTEFKLDNVNYSIRSDKSCVVDATVSNIGAVDGDEVVQVYLAEKSTPYKKQLVGFSRIGVSAGEHTVVKIKVPAEYIVSYSNPQLMVGTSSEDIVFTEQIAVKKSKERLTPHSFEQVTLNDNFWLPRLKIQKETLVPFALENTAPAVENLRRVGEYLKHGKEEKLLPLPRYVASDLFKVMEGAAYLLAIDRDPELEKQLDAIIDIIADAQLPDGYLFELHAVPMRMAGHDTRVGSRPYSDIQRSHELYNMGHMYEAAIAYFKATGKRKFLDVAEKNAQHINRAFFEGDPDYNDGVPVRLAPGHQELELALVKLYEATGNTLYREMAKKFLDIRGVTFIPGGGIRGVSGKYTQQHLPVREQMTAEGHSVRALYMYAGMSDVYSHFDDASMYSALYSIWHNIADSKIHITGGLGSVPGTEGFGPKYDLPNKDTYDETCAAVGNVFFNYRMFLATGEAKYIDMAEISLFNNVLAAVNFEGNRFFYVNVLQADGRRAFNRGNRGRSPWFDTACCPTNMARLVPQVPGMVYSHDGNNLYCGFYAGCTTSVTLDCGKVGLNQKTDYPYDGKIRLEVEPETDDMEFTIWLRIPTWCSDRFMPGNLYSYADNYTFAVTANINGEGFSADSVDGFMPITRKWKKGDVVELNLEMPVRYNVADERVEADRNRVCLTRGPLLYCAEQVDNTYPAYRYVIPKVGDESKVELFTDGIMNGIKHITLDAVALSDDESPIESKLKLIPYYAWNNRGDETSMNVWFARDTKTAMSDFYSGGDNIKTAETSVDDSGNILSVIDGKFPKKSNDKSIPCWTIGSNPGKQQILVTLHKAQPIESVSVFFHDDTENVLVPASWSMEYRYNGSWHEFVPYMTDSFGVSKDHFNVVHPDKDIKADAIRVNLVPQTGKGLGIYEITVE